MGCGTSSHFCYVVSASSDKTARVWDVATGEELVRVDHQGYVLSAQLAVRGTRAEVGEWILITASDDGTARIWRARPRKLPLLVQEVGHEQDRLGVCPFDDVPRGTELLRVTHEGAQVRVALLDGSGQWLVTAGHDGTARLWDAVSGREVSRASHPPSVTCAHFGGKGQTLLLTGGEDGGVKIWSGLNSPAAVEIKSFQHEGSAKVLSAKFDSSATRVVTATDAGCACVWNVASGQLLLTVCHETSAAVRYAEEFTNQRRRQLLTCADDKTVRLWDALQGDELERIELNSAVSMASALLRAGQLQILTAAADGSVTLWQYRKTHRSDLQALTSGVTGNFEKIGEFVHDLSVQTARFYAMTGAW